MISSAKHGVEECSLIARDIFSTSPSKLPTSPGQLPLKRPLQVSGDHLSEPRLLSPLRSSALQHSSQRSNRRALMLLMEEAVSLKIYERERTGRELRAKLVTRLLFSTVGVAWPGSLSLDSFGMRSEVLNFSAGDFPMMGLGLSGVRVMVESENDLGENTAPVPSNSIWPQPISVSLIV